MPYGMRKLHRFWRHAMARPVFPGATYWLLVARVVVCSARRFTVSSC